MFKIGERIEKPRMCVGDVEHNKMCDKLIDSTPWQISKEIFAFIEKECAEREFQWIHFWLTKKQVDSICNLMKSRDVNIFNRRLTNMIRQFSRSPFVYLLNQKSIELLFLIDKLMKEKILPLRMSAGTRKK